MCARCAVREAGATPPTEDERPRTPSADSFLTVRVSVCSSVCVGLKSSLKVTAERQSADTGEVERQICQEGGGQGLTRRKS